jgi:HK97 family phage portal protein
MLNGLTRAWMTGLKAQGYTFQEDEGERAWRQILSFGGSQTIRQTTEEIDVLEASEIHDVVFACVRAVSWTAAQVPLILTEGNQEVTSHPILDLLESPNTENTRFDLIEGIVWQLMVGGNSFQEIVFEGKRPSQIWPITELVEVIPDSNGLVSGYRVRFRGRTQDFTRDQILHIKLFHPRNSWYGLSPLQAYREGLITDLQSFTYNRMLLQNGAIPGGIIAVDYAITEAQAQEMARRWAEAHKGANRAGRVAVLQRGAKYQTVALSPKDVAFVQQRKLSVDSIKRLYGVPGVMLGEDEGVTQNAANVSSQVFYTNTIIPLLRKVEATLNHRLIPFFTSRRDSKRLRLYFDPSRVESLQESTQLKATIGLQLLQQCWSPNMIFKYLWKLPPIEADWANQSYIPANLIPVGLVNQSVLGQTPKPLSADVEQAFLRSLQEQINTPSQRNAATEDKAKMGAI